MTITVAFRAIIISYRFLQFRTLCFLQKTFSSFYSNCSVQGLVREMLYLSQQEYVTK